MTSKKQGVRRPGQHYVYLVRDLDDRIRYVGYGRRPSRATAHLYRSHNPDLGRFLRTRPYKIEIAGPFRTEEVGRAVEAAMISVLGTEFNEKHDGNPEWRFRPLGVPDLYAERLLQRPLQKADFAKRSQRGPTLFVHIGEEAFDDGRPGYNPALPPTDDEIRERIDRWWQLERYREVWARSHERSPHLLVAIHGAPGAQIVIAAARIDRSAWRRAETCPEGGGKISIPLSSGADLDAFAFRGRRVDAKAGLRFDGITAGFYIILYPSGRKTGGRRPRH